MKKIQIVAPSSKTKGAKEILESSVEKLQNYFPSHHIVFESNIFDEEELPFCASSQKNRLQQMAKALNDPEVEIIWAFRGGVGSTEIMHDLLNIVPSGQKTLIGFSDITPLHYIFNCHFQFQTMHGAVITSLFSEGEDNRIKEIINLLSGGASNFLLSPVNQTAKMSRNTLRYTLVGGNLSLICNMIGTAANLDLHNKILILEDVYEKGYKVYRYLIHILNAGLLKGLKAIIFADFTQSDEYVDDVINYFCSNYASSIPCYRVQNIGHGAINRPIMLGRQVTINANTLNVPSFLKLI